MCVFYFLLNGDKWHLIQAKINIITESCWRHHWFTFELHWFLLNERKYISAWHTGSYLKSSHIHWVLGKKMLTILLFPYSIWQGKITEFLWEKVGFIVNLCFWEMIKERMMWLSYLIVFRENNDASVSLMDSCFSQSWQYRILGILLQFLFSKKFFPVNNFSLWEWYIKSIRHAWENMRVLCVYERAILD